MDKRIRRMNAVMNGCLMRGAGCWMPQRTIIQAIERLETRWLRRILGIKKHVEETWQTFYHRAADEAHRIRRNMDIPSVVHSLLQSHRRWMGHAVREDPGIPTSEALAWRDIAWWRTQQELERHGGQGGVRHFKNSV